MTEQEIFDTAVVGVIRQGGPSIALGSGCSVYRGPGGRKCAVGHLLSDREVMKIGEHNVVTRAMPERLEQFVDLISDLQTAHDDSVVELMDCEDFLSVFADKCRRIARGRKLSTKAMDEAMRDATTQGAEQN